MYVLLAFRCVSSSEEDNEKLSNSGWGNINIIDICTESLWDTDFMKISFEY